MLIIDRIEGQWLICENKDKEVVHLKKDQAPPEVKEGDVLVYSKDKDTYHIDPDQTQARRARIEAKASRLFTKSKD